VLLDAIAVTPVTTLAAFPEAPATFVDGDRVSPRIRSAGQLHAAASPHAAAEERDPDRLYSLVTTTRLDASGCVD
jgi:hypothetical protein